ncbi:hypothetical protein [Calothrix sp. 336/3]|uniref:hypothetical protein n=1 Tax=Calothrix sp. 336/3 TaxID=1337936 RepID=UPI0004E424C5|nr:hypothetical protein [Calothrix sp. 336/3]AKG19964.1 hypothetical protein IJ00_00315 [Calothrix sp. 336/3]
MLVSRRIFLQKASIITSVSAIGTVFPSLLARAQTLPKHLKDALEMLSGLRPENNNYQHRPTIFIWKGVGEACEYVSKTDCSGFINKLLSHSYSRVVKEDFFKEWMGKERPLAKDYHQIIFKQEKFTLITDIKKVMPGDIIAIRYKKDEDKSGNTGHLLLVAGVPEAPSEIQNLKPNEQDMVHWKVSVIDQSNSGHGKKDSRYKNNGFSACISEDKRYCAFYSGLGKGFFRISTNKKGEIVGYSWSLCEESEFYPVEINDYNLEKDEIEKNKRHLVIGRLQTQFFT